MEPDIDSFVLLYHSFSYSQKLEAIRRLNEYIEGAEAMKGRIIKESEQRNSVKKMDVGPTSVASCVCCGR